MLSSWPHPAPNADMPASVTFSHPFRRILRSLQHRVAILLTHSSVKLLQPSSPICSRSDVFSNDTSHKSTRQASTFICSLDTLIPRIDSHFSEDALWTISSRAADLTEWRKLIQFGRHFLLETAISRVAILRTSSQWDRKRVCRSSLSRYRSNGTIAISCTSTITSTSSLMKQASSQRQLMLSSLQYFELQLSDLLIYVSTKYVSNTKYFVDHYRQHKERP